MIGIDILLLGTAAMGVMAALLLVMMAMFWGDGDGP
jgi:hypothetical protein